MAGAAVIAAVTNALDQREFPFVFGGDGASFAVPPADLALAREAMAATAAWVRDDLGLNMRVALVPVAEIRAKGLDIRVARFAPSKDVSYAMFSGGGLAWAEAAIKRGEFAIAPAPPGTAPDLSGLSCRFEEFPSERGIILSALVMPAADANADAFRSVIESVISLVEKSPDAGRPVHRQGIAIPLAAGGLRARSARHAKRGPRVVRRSIFAATTLFSYVILRLGLRVGDFSSGKIYRRSRRQQRLPQIRRRLADDPRLHRGTGRRARTQSRRCRGARHRPLRAAPAGRSDDDMLHAVAVAQRSRAFHRWRQRRLCVSGNGIEGCVRLTAEIILPVSRSSSARQGGGRRGRKTGPGLPAAEHAHAALDLKRRVVLHGDVGRVGLAVVGVVDPAAPFARRRPAACR